MKKTVLTIIICLAAATASAQTGNTAGKPDFWHRLEFGATYNTLVNPDFRFGPGLLSHHPERAFSATASVRLWKHLEAGVYGTLQGANPFGDATSTPVSPSSDTRLYTVGWRDNDLHLSGGVFVAAHTDQYLDDAIDMVARLGFGLNGETDGVWGGIGFEVALCRQLRLTWYIDYGGFPLGNMMEITDNTTSFRNSFGLKFRL